MAPLRLLLIEDSEDDAALVIRGLSKAGYVVASERVDTPEGLVAALERQRWDLVIADYTMPRFSGTAALALLREYDSDMPFIFVSGTMGEDAAVAAMKTGAHDYIMKGNLKRLVPAVERELRDAGDRVSRRVAEARLAHLAYHDALTDLPNRVLLHDRLQQAILGAQRDNKPVTLMVLDLDGFKAVNDSLGHHAGDRVLQLVASRLRAMLRDVDTVARLGGDEFALLLPRTDADGSMATAHKVLEELKHPLLLDGRAIVVGGSLGLAWFPEHGSNADTLLQKADIAMYAAKSGGYGFTVYAPDRDHHAHRRLALVTELREGIERDQFAFEYQPIVHLQTGLVSCVEALARWHHPGQGRLLPNHFIEIAEQTGLIDPLMMLLLNKALAEWARPDHGLPMCVAVNLSPRNLRDADLPDRIADVLRIAGAAPSALKLEITENLIISDPHQANASLSRLHDMGIKLAIDDFGAGYSSLGYLRRLPVDEVKIDRSFVIAMAGGDDAIVRSAIDLAHNLGLTVVAEGVESAEVRDRLRQFGCDAAQGHFLAEPGPPGEIRRWVARQNAAGMP
jgi:diguanylate cyclase (GGDEF)-like protein